MVKQNLFCTFYDKTFQLSISELKAWGYIQNGRSISGKIQWKRNSACFDISILLAMQNNQPYLELIYQFKGDLIKYSINMTSISSNLGKGTIWYFLCPKTNKRCRILYFIQGYFLHRDAFKSMYYCQTKSKKTRNIDKTLGKLYKAEQLLKITESNHFKKKYSGKPTKRYELLLKQLRETKEISHIEIVKSLI